MICFSEICSRRLECRIRVLQGSGTNHYPQEISERETTQLSSVIEQGLGLAVRSQSKSAKGWPFEHNLAAGCTITQVGYARLTSLGISFIDVPYAGVLEFILF